MQVSPYKEKNGGASVNKTKLNAGLALWQRDDLLQANNNFG